eukprot:sb/3465064/
MVAKRSPDNENNITQEQQRPSKKAKTETEKKVESLRILPDHITEPNQDRLSLLSTSSHLCLLEGTTPDLVLATKGGQLPHVTKDLYQPLGVEVVCLDSVVQGPGRNGLETMGVTLGQFYKARGEVLLNPYNSYTAPDMTTFNDQLTVSVWTKAGRKKINNNDYLEFVETAKPDLFVALADVVPACVNKKRADKSCYRTLNWLTETLTRCTGDKKVLAVLPGSGHAQLMLKSAQILSTRDVYGYVIERATLPLKDWAPLLRKVISLLPPSRPIYMFGVLNELELIEAYRSGCHYVDTSFLSRYASQGLALTNNPPTDNEPLPTTTTTAATGEFGPSLASAAPEQHVKQEKGDNKRGVKLVFTPEQLVDKEKCSRVMDLTEGQYSRQFIGIENTLGGQQVLYTMFIFVSGDIRGSFIKQ